VNKKDIRLEVPVRAKELRDWAVKLDWASPALAKFFREQADYIESANYDSWGATMMMGKVNGLTAAAFVLLEEWKQHNA
jgi:hypothetical protein